MTVAEQQREPQMQWILRTLALTRALARHGSAMTFMVRRGLLSFTGRVLPKGGMVAGNDNERRMR